MHAQDDKGSVLLGQGGTVLAQIHCFAVRLSLTLDNARQRGYKAPE